MANPFHWSEGGTVILAGATSTSNIALTKMPTGRVQIRLYNAGTVAVFIKKGTDSTVTAAVTDLPIAPGAVEVLTLNNNEAAPITHIAGITGSSTASLYITAGAGI